VFAVTTDVPAELADLDPETDGFDDAPARHQLVSSGVCSQVYGDDRQLVGHVLMVEYDDVAREVAERDARFLPGVTVLLRSSARCWHVYDLGVRSWDRTVELARSTSCCPLYRDEQVDLGRFALRTFEKIRRTGDVYRDAPVPVAVVDGDGPLSWPHAETLRQLAVEVDQQVVADTLDDLVDERPTVGRTLRTTDYETYTDELAAVLGGETNGE
jgi:hypothetical protein